ncbi:MAG: hypothetical protein ACK56G_04825, partial [Pirellulaceae bacterium]
YEATHWKTHQVTRQRTRRRSMCRHGQAWIGKKAKAIGQKCEKPCENLWFCSGDDRNRTFSCFPNVSGEFERHFLMANYAGNKPFAVARL